MTQERLNYLMIVHKDKTHLLDKKVIVNECISNSEHHHCKLLRESKQNNKLGVSIGCI